jgi:serine O-acetyltransferase
MSTVAQFDSFAAQPVSTSLVPPHEAPISATQPDWSREKCQFCRWEPSKRLIRSIRRYQKWRGKAGPVGWLISKWAVLSHRFWSIICGADIPLNVALGGGISMPHPNGIVINPGSEIGVNCLILQQVTIGYSGGKRVGNPKIGGHVDIGAGAKVLGNVTIGDHAKIGANAVVLCDVPQGATAVGIPARVIDKPVEM